MNIVISDDYQNVVSSLKCFELLKDFNVKIFNDSVSEIDKLAERFKDADCIVLIRERTKITRELLDRLPKLKLISQTGKVSGHIDLEACKEKGIAIAEGSGSPIAPAELTWTLIMTAVRRIIPAVNDMKLGKWQTNIGETLHGKTLGIWGFGKIGKLIALYGKAFGMNVLVWGSDQSRLNAEKEGYISAKTKNEFFKTSDVLSIHLRLKPETKEIIKYDDLIKMKTNSLFVNTSRAELIEKGALEKALIKGNPGYAALDVYEYEPVYDPDYWALKLDNVICTPHLGYVEMNSYEYYFETAFRNVISFFNEKPENLIF